MAHKHQRHQNRKGRRGRAHGTQRGNFPRGVLEVSAGGYGFVDTDEGSFYIPENRMNSAMNGDYVEVRPRQHEKLCPGGKRVAVVVAVHKRATEYVPGVLEFADPLAVVVPNDPRMRHDIFVSRDECPEAAAGDVVLARITSYPTRTSPAQGYIVEVLGRADEPGIDVDMLVHSAGLATEFSPQALEQAAACACDIEGALAEPGRRDLRERCVFTIDPADAKDFDDAVSIEHVEGLTRLGVHIADVSSYVEWDSSLDIAARDRATSVYLADRVLPMLPEKLSNDICSLRPGEDRRAMTCDMYLDAAARVVRYEIYPSVIRSKRRFNYDEVQAVLDAHASNGCSPAEDGASLRDAFFEGSLTTASASPSHVRDDEPEHPQLRHPEQRSLGFASASSKDPSQNAPRSGAPSSAAAGVFTPKLLELNALAHQLSAAAATRGALDFDTAEAKPVLDETGHCTEIRVRRKTDATNMIEQAMILANETVASHLHKLQQPCVYRIHLSPRPKSLEALLPTLKELGYDITGLGGGTPRAYQAVLQQAAGRPDEALVNNVVLRSMERACYSTAPEGHFGLAATHYCHFTSPIRRYPDLMVHRLLKDPQAMEGQLDWLAEHSSKMERVAEQAERDTVNLKICDFLSRRVGEVFEGTISTVLKRGFYVRLDNTAEGFVGFDPVKSEYHEFDPKLQTLVGQESGRTYRLGQRIRVRITRVDMREQTIDFEVA